MAGAQNGKSKKNAINLKRQVVVKAVVTETFKKYLHEELKQVITQNNNRLTQIQNQMNQLNDNQPHYIQLQSEKEQLMAYNAAEMSHRKGINDLKIGDYYSQGPVDGFVSVSVGDDLYNKLSGIEIIVEDGKIKAFNKVSPNFQNLIR